MVESARFVEDTIFYVGDRVKVFWSTKINVMKELVPASTNELELIEPLIMTGIKKLSRCKMNNTLALNKMIITTNHLTKPLMLRTVLRLKTLRLYQHVYSTVKEISL